jgi:hypothetical protein
VRAEIKRLLQTAKSVTMVIDGWSQFQRKFLGVGCTFIDGNFVLREVSLGLIEIHAPQTGEHIAFLLNECTKVYLGEGEGSRKVTNYSSDTAANMKVRWSSRI